MDELTGWKTFVPNTDGTAPSSPMPDSALPSPPNTRSKPMGPTQFNTPPSSEDALDGKPLHTDRKRTLAIPGDDLPPASETEWSPYPKRRQNMEASECEAAMTGPTFPGQDRQKEQKGEAKRYFKRYYLQNRSKINQRMKRWYRKNKAKPALKKDRARRDKYPNRFVRFPGGYGSNKERAQEQREKTATWDVGIPLWYLPLAVEASLLSVDTEAETAKLALPGRTEVIPLDDFFDSVIFESEEDLDKVFTFLDDAMGYVPGEETLSKEESEEETLMDQWYFPDPIEKQSWMLERIAPDVPSEQVYNRASPYEPYEHIHEPLPGFAPDQGQQVYDNPGSAKVIPWNSDMVNNKAAAKFVEIQKGCDTKLQSKAQKIKPVVVRADISNLLWLFDVPSSEGPPYRVRVKAIAKGNTMSLAKMDILVSCTCPYWQWQGPEYHAKVNGYLYGKPQGTATKPQEKDPDEKHRVCKHVLAVFDKMAKWTLMRPRKKQGAEETATIRVARRYLEAVWRRGAENADV